ncbi:type VI secretion protein [Burkholderia sp. SRS-46]|nr:type VI secretion protein [Burkholderia sp. SRS-46]
MFANCSAGGMAMAGSDVCKTPPIAIPISYPNIANKCEAVPNVPTIIYCGGPVHNLNTIIPITHGDEAGSMGGAASGTVSGLSRHVTGSGKVMIQGAPQTRLTDTNLPNNQNTAGQTIAPSQTITMTLS